MPFLLENVSRDGQQVIIYQDPNLKRSFSTPKTNRNLPIKINYNEIATQKYRIKLLFKLNMVIVTILCML